MKLRHVLRAPMILGLVALLAGIGASCGDAANASGPVSVSVSSSAVGHAEPSGFLGLSMEYRGLAAYAGTSSTKIDQPFAQLVSNLAPGGSPELRVGGDSTDWSWWPVPGMAQPGGVRFALTPQYMAAAKALIDAVHGHYVLGINFEADSRKVAATEASAIVNRIGRSAISALELGNEPELYASFPWYKSASGQHVYGRPHSYTSQSYIGDFGNIASALPSGVPVAGPSSGSEQWLSSLGDFAGHESRLRMVTVHAYPLKHCVPTEFAKASQLFDSASLQGLANMVGGWEKIAAAHHLPLRVDEMNSISCGGQRNLTPAFAPALWAVDVLPRLLATGAAGVNFHTIPNTFQSLIKATQGGSGWQVTVQPEYYGLLMFAEAAPTGATLLRVSAPSAGGLDEWATRAPNGQVHVVLINTSASTATANVKVPSVSGSATVTRLRAPGLLATSGVTLGGQTISPKTGALTGPSTATTVAPSSGAYPVSVPGYSAAMLTLGG